MNVLHVINIFFSLSYFGNQFKYLSNKGYCIHVACSPSPNLKSYSIKQNISFIEVEILRSISPFHDIWAIYKLSKYIKENNIDMVVGHTPKGALLSMLAARLMRVKKRIYYRHGLIYDNMFGFKYKLMKFVDRFTAYNATKIVNVSDYLNKKAISDNLNSSQKQLIIGKGSCGGIDTVNKFNPEKIDNVKREIIKNSLEITDDYLVIGFCGRLVNDKGIPELIEAFTSLKKTMKIKLLLVGDFDTRDSVSDYVEDLIENDKDIIKTGFIFNDIEYYYSLMNIFVFPSYREGFGISAIEASAMQLPVLVTSETGCAETIINNETGLYIDNTAKSIFENIHKLINSSEFNQMGINGRAFVMKHFENSILWEKIEENLYKN